MAPIIHIGPEIGSFAPVPDDAAAGDRQAEIVDLLFHDPLAVPLTPAMDQMQASFPFIQAHGTPPTALRDAAKPLVLKLSGRFSPPGQARRDRHHGLATPWGTCPAAT